MGFREELIRKLLGFISVLTKGQITKGEAVKVLKKFADELHFKKEWPNTSVVLSLEGVENGS